MVNSSLTRAIKTLAFYAGTTGIVSACNNPEDVQPVGAATIRVTIATTGIDIDSDGYLLSIDGQTPQRVAANGTTSVEVAAGRRSISLTGISSNCGDSDGANRTITVSAERVSGVPFTVVCRIRQLAFASDRSGSYQVYVMDRDGGNVRRLSNNSASEFATGWSPDGAQLAFSSDIAGNYDVFLMNADGSNRRALTTSSAFDGTPSFSPDGNRIAFRSDRDGNGEIYAMNADGSGQTRLTTTLLEREDGPQWSPDGTRIVYQVTTDNLTQIRVMNADGSAVQTLTGAGAEQFHPSWSPDGSRIAFIGRSSSLIDPVFPQQLSMMKPDGSEQKQVTTGYDYYSLPHWSPDGQQLACTSFGNNRYQIRLLSADGTSQVAFPVSGYSDYLALWRP